jgi:hypothetical protein
VLSRTQRDRHHRPIAADAAPGTQAEKAVRDKPAPLVDSCYDVSLTKITDATQCKAMYPYYRDPRLAAGAPPTDDVLKCAMKPVVATDYRAGITHAQLDALRSVFLSGVCDFTKSPIGKVPLADTSLSYPTPGR